MDLSKYFNEDKTRVLPYKLKNITEDEISYVKEATRPFDCLNPSIAHRLKFIRDGVTSIPSCKNCERPARAVLGSGNNYFRDSCGNFKCSIAVNPKEALRRSRMGDTVREFQSKRKDFIKNLDETISCGINEELAWFKENQSRLLGGHYISDAYNGSLPVISIINSANRLGVEVSEYLYRAINNLISRPICIECKVSEVSYRDFVQGYSTVCPDPKCWGKLARTTRSKTTARTLKEHFKDADFDIVCPDIVNREKAIIIFPCGHEQERWIKNSRWKEKFICNTCNLSSQSKPEFEIKEYIESFGFEVIHQYRLQNSLNKTSYSSLDLYIPEVNLAIEYSGLLYHSFGSGGFIDNADDESVGKFKHLQKIKYCDELGISLITIFENEWISKNSKEKLKSMIRTRLGASKKRIYARNCEVKFLSSKDYSSFLEVYHLQGNCNSSIRYGLFYKDALLSVMGFSKSRFSDKVQWELIRYAVLDDAYVVGGAQKLLTHFERINKPNSLISYSDRRFFTGNVYRKLGFDELEPTTPNYFYVPKSKDRLLSRHQFQKHKLHRILKLFDPTKTETENCFANGFRRIWDCGHHKFIKYYT